MRTVFSWVIYYWPWSFSPDPEAVRNLIVYKRSKNDLWLRWSEPEEFTYIAGSSAKISDDFKIVYTYPGGVVKSEEIAMTKCKTWPDYFCHRIRGLVPNKEYTISVSFIVLIRVARLPNRCLTGVWLIERKISNLFFAEHISIRYLVKIWCLPSELTNSLVCSTVLLHKTPSIV